MDIVKKIIKEYIEKKRPPIELRKELDIGYTFEKNVLEIFEIRPQWNDNSKTLNIPITKVKYIKSKEIWKIYWKGGNENWKFYEPSGEINSIRDVLTEIDKDTHGCFWG